jgi:maleylacetate reductase
MSKVGIAADTTYNFDPNPARIVFGAGKIDSTAHEAERLGLSNMLVVCSNGRRQAAERAALALGDKCAGICDAAVTSMSEAAFDTTMAEIKRTGADSILSLGGGSPLGLGKAVVHESGLPHMSAPTTYSGSELRGDWRVETPDGMRNGDDPDCRPVVVIYDPELTVDLPPSVSGPSGMNAMAHAVESLYSLGANPVSMAVAELGIAALSESLPLLVKNPGDMAARALAFQGTWLAGGFRAGSCLEHRMAQTIRRVHRMTHAQSHAVSLPFVVAYNEPAAPAAMARIARALGADGASAGLFQLNDALGIPTSLAALGMDEARLDETADLIAAREIPNPRPLNRDDVRIVLDNAFHGRRTVAA